MPNRYTESSKPTPPLDVSSSEGLGPEEREKLVALLDHIYEYGTAAEGVLRLAAQLCQAVRAAERERIERDVAGLHMAQSLGNQNYPRAWHDGIDAALEAIRGA